VRHEGLLPSDDTEDVERLGGDRVRESKDAGIGLRVLEIENGPYPSCCTIPISS
jgi:hypothetical protein